MDRPRARRHGSGWPASRSRRMGCACVTWGMALLALLLSAAAAVSWFAPAARVASAEDLRQWQRAFGEKGQLGSAPGGAMAGTFTTEQFTGRDGGLMRYYLYVPTQSPPTPSYPIVLLLHGSGESAGGSDSPEQNRSRILQQQYVQAWVTPTAQAQYPCFVVVPQVLSGTRWENLPANEGTDTQPTAPATALNTAMDIVAAVEAAYSSIDRQRLYITGISMGAYGVWDAIERWPWRFAAAAPLAGAGDPARAEVAAHLPIWDFHGASDFSDLVTNSHAMYSAIHAAGGSSCATEFPGVGHDLWNTVQVYQNATFRQWLFSQTRAASSATQARSCTGLSINGVRAK